MLSALGAALLLAVRGHAALRQEVLVRPVARATSWQGHRMADGAWKGSRDLPQKLLLQSAIQAQLSYAQEFKNE